MTDSPPAHLSIDPRSPHYNAEALAKGVGVRFQGRERTDVLEYSVAEGWIKVAAGTSRDRYGNPMTVKLKGAVEVYYDDAQPAKIG